MKDRRRSATVFFSPKGKNVDIPFFYAFLMLETTDLTSVSRKLGDGVGASAGFGAVGGGKNVSETKKRKQDDLSTHLQQLTKKWLSRQKK